MTEISSTPAAATMCQTVGHVEATRIRTDTLYRQYRHDVSLICRSLLRDHCEAEDATQQVFLSAHRALLRGAAPREPAAWVAAIARNECRARIRVRMSTPLAVPDDCVDRLAADPPAEAIQRAELAAFWLALADLPGAQRDALLLREIRGLSYEQLATELSLSHPSVRSLLGRARQQLRLRLRDIHAGLAGVSWLEALARLFSGGANPVVGKAVALGLGAAAITGGAVVTPEMLDHLDHDVYAVHAHVVPHMSVRQTPSVRASPHVVASATSEALGSGGRNDRRGRDGRPDRNRLRHRVGGDHRSGDGDATSGTVRSGGDSSGSGSGSSSSSDGDGAQLSGSGDGTHGGDVITTTDSGSSERDGSGSGDRLSTDSGGSYGSSLFSSGEGASSSDGGTSGGGDSGESGSSGGS